MLVGKKREKKRLEMIYSLNIQHILCSIRKQRTFYSISVSFTIYTIAQYIESFISGILRQTFDLS